MSIKSVLTNKSIGLEISDQSQSKKGIQYSSLEAIDSSNDC